MKVETIELWYSVYEGSAGEVVIDYMIRPEESDQILAVNFSLDGKIVAIDWES